METRVCIYCNSSFEPNKYAPRQKICSKPECQKTRQLESMKVWRERNPNYFKYDESKGLVWLETQRKRSKQWREKNPDKVRNYRQTHNEEYRNYMREYMRKYREMKKGGEAPPPPTPPGNTGDTPANP